MCIFVVFMYDLDMISQSDEVIDYIYIYIYIYIHVCVRTCAHMGECVHICCIYV